MLSEHGMRPHNALWSKLKNPQPCFTAGKDAIAEEGKKVLKSIHYESTPPEVQKSLRTSRAQEWSKFESFGVVPLTPDQVQELVTEGHQTIPSKWVDVNKAQYKNGRAPNYQPQYKSRLVPRTLRFITLSAAGAQLMNLIRIWPM